MAQPGKKSLRDQPELYTEVKVRTSIALTPSARQALDQLAQSFNLSRSEFIEQIARGEFQIRAKGVHR